MKRVVTASLTIGLFTAAAGGLIAFSGTAKAAQQKLACGERKGVLGVERVVEIDTTNGLRFGNMQYKDIDFLKPGEVVLTFDDGPLRPKTTAVLNALEAHCTKATFFMVGRMALVDPDMVKEIDRRGHTVGTHSWSHKMQGKLGQSSAETEFELGLSAVSLALGKPAAPFFRFPYLSDPRGMQSHIKERDQGIFSIDVDSLDFRTRSGETMINRTMSGLKRLGKGIILMHDIQTSTARGISDLLDRLNREGFKVVHIVAKSPSKTLQRYDEMAEKEAARRKKVAESMPLAARSMVWPVASADAFPAAEPLAITPPGLFKGPLPERSGATRTPHDKLRKTITEVEEQTADVRPSNKKSPAEPAMRKEPPQPDWRDKIFNN